MDTTELYAVLLGLTAHWDVVEVRVDETEKRVDVLAAHEPGSRFPCRPRCRCRRCRRGDSCRRAVVHCQSSVAPWLWGRVDMMIIPHRPRPGPDRAAPDRDLH